MTWPGYQWADTPSGQYIDGHEYKDLVTYRQNMFLPGTGGRGGLTQQIHCDYIVIF